MPPIHQSQVNVTNTLEIITSKNIHENFHINKKYAQSKILKRGENDTRAEATDCAMECA